jgi:hypothetical protein
MTVTTEQFAGVVVGALQAEAERQADAWTEGATADQLPLCAAELNDDASNAFTITPVPDAELLIGCQEFEVQLPSGEGFTVRVLAHDAPEFHSTTTP